VAPANARNWHSAHFGLGKLSTQYDSQVVVRVRLDNCG
jgi:hypothetical protein